MKISTKGRYALEAVVDLACHSKTELESLRSIAERLSISKNYLEQLFVGLKKAELVDSVRGARGGYRLAKAAEETTVGEVLRAVEGSLSPVACLDEESCGQEAGRYQACATRVVWQGMLDEINKVVDTVTIGDLAACCEQMNQGGTIEYYI